MCWELFGNGDEEDNDVVQNPADGILFRAEHLDTQRRHTEALILYEQGIELLKDEIAVSNRERAIALSRDLRRYEERCNQVKTIIQQNKSLRSFSEKIYIKDNEQGYGYDRIFKPYLDKDIKRIRIEDAYIRSYNQCQNFLRLCEVFVKNCVNLKVIELVTRHENEDQNGTNKKAINDQIKNLNTIKSGLASNFNIKLIIEFSETLHDRQILLSNGYIIKIGRGINIYKPVENKFSIGSYDLNFRKCMQTNIDISYDKNLTAAMVV